MQEDLVEICRKFTLSEDDFNVVIPEPYFPYIPENWNKVLVLAESQNLSLSNSEYVDELLRMTSEQRMARLGYDTEFVGVYPWDDGSIKLAIEASLKIRSEETGVSNAVLWSQRGSNGQNVNPEIGLEKASSRIWLQFFESLDPEMVVCCGKVAAQVINKSGWGGDVLHLRLPSRSAMSRISGMFSESDLMARYPEVRSVIDKNPAWVEGGYRLNKIFYACHAVSLSTKT